MKKILVITAVFFAGTLGTTAIAQSKAGQKIEHGAKKTGHAVKKGGKAVGHKTAEVSSKGTSKIADKKLNDKAGPNNETVYMTADNRYYWVDDRGRRHYIPKSALKSRHFN